MEENNNLNKSFKVYMHVSPNGKRYIGITCQRPIRRWGGNGYGYIDNEYFWRAIQKYGWDNFQHEILFTGLTKEEAEQKEIELIALYDSTDPSKGYNITAGGSYVFNVTLRPVKQYTTDGVFIKEYNCIQDASEFTGVNKGNISLCCNNNAKTACGYIWMFSENELTEEHLAWCNSDGHKNKWISVCQYSKNGDFIHKYENISLAASENNTNPTSIISCCKGESKFTGDSIWRYANEELTKEHLEWCNSLKENPRKISVIQYLKDGTFVCSYESIAEASLKTGINHSSIGMCCRRETKTAGGYIWRYYNTELTEEDIKWCNSRIINVKKVPVTQYSLDGEFIKTWGCMTEAKEEFGFDISAITRCCRREQTIAYNYIWRYVDDILTDEDLKLCHEKIAKIIKKKVSQYTLNGEFINKFENATEVKRILGFDNSHISKACRNGRPAYGYIWRYTDEC